MHRLTETRMSRLGIAALASVLALVAWTAAPSPAAAQIFFGYSRFYTPFSYYPPPAYYPYYAPPPAYYPAPAYYPPAAPAAAPATSAATSAAITYTDRPAFKNAAGQTCREYKTANGVLGTACQDSSGQWRAAY